jgi:MraZ protein
MFRGVNNLTVDAKGRMAVPTKYRDRIHAQSHGQLVLTIDTEERCLLLYPLPTWEDIERKLDALPSFNKAARRVQRLLIGHATEVEMDSHGRLLLPPPLREFAGMDKKVVLIGQGKKFEVWDEQSWNDRRESWLEEENETDLGESAGLDTLSL